MGLEHATLFFRPPPRGHVARDRSQLLTLHDLGAHQRRILECVSERGVVETRQVAAALGLSPANVGTVLLQLQRFWFLEREEVRDRAALHYVLPVAVSVV